MLKAKLSLIFLLAVFWISAQSQTFKHPYSFYGIGIPEDIFTAKDAGMAGISVSVFNPLSCSPINPATYSALEYTNFSMSFRGKIFNLHQDTLHSWSNLFSFGHFGLGFPLLKKISWKASLGLQPLSRLGYNSIYSISGGHDTIDFTDKFDLTGGFSRVYLGSSVRILKELYLGVNFNYIFGNTHIYHSLLFDDELAFLGILSDKNSFYGNINFDFGFTGRIKISENKYIQAGGFFTPSCRLKITEDEVVTNYLNEASKITFKDTVLKTSLVGGEFTLPQKFGFGLSFHTEKKLFIGSEYTFEKWSDFTFPGISQQLKNQHEFSLGCEFTPNFEDLSYFRRMSYRAGIKYALSYLNVPINLNNTTMGHKNLTKAALTVGTSFPIRKTNSFIDVAFEAGKIGKAYEDIIREIYFLLNVGFRFNDNWFIKGKYE